MRKNIESSQLKIDEKLIYETNVKYGKYNSNVHFSLTNQRILFLKEKGIFRKKLKTIDEILINNIKMYKDKVQIKQKRSTIFVQTFDKKYKFTCNNIFEAKKIVEEIIIAKTGNNILDRANNKINNAFQNFKKISSIIGVIALLPSGIKKLNENKDKIIDFVKNTIKR